MTYSYLGFLNGKLRLDSKSAEEKKSHAYSYLGFLNGYLSLSTDSTEKIKSLEFPNSLHKVQN